MGSHDKWGIPIRGEKVPVTGRDGVTSMEEVQSVDTTGLPVIGGGRWNDPETYKINGEVARRKIQRKELAERGVAVATSPELAELIDMGGIGGRVSAA